MFIEIILNGEPITINADYIKSMHRLPRSQKFPVGGVVLLMSDGVAINIEMEYAVLRKCLMQKYSSTL